MPTIQKVGQQNLPAPPKKGRGSPCISKRGQLSAENEKLKGMSKALHSKIRKDHKKDASSQRLSESLGTTSKVRAVRAGSEEHLNY